MTIGKRAWFGLIGLGVIVGCNRAPDLVVDDALLARYHELAAPVVMATASSDIDCYLDYSAGMGEGMRATAAVNASLKNFLGGRRVTYFKVGAVADPLQIDINSAAANLVDLSNYREAGSKLKVAIDRMTAQKNKVSLFITDFERVEDVSLRQQLPGAPAPHPIDASAWAQINFREWLLAGNRVDIFATQYTKPDYWFERRPVKTYPNWIYTIVFTPGAIVSDESAFKSSVVPFLIELYRTGSTSRHFSYTANGFRSEQTPLPATGNANENIVVQDHSVNSFSKGFEYYEFTADDLVNFNTDSTQEDKRIINKSRVISEVPFFSGQELGIKVYDVTDPLTALFDAANQGPPETTTDVETGQTATTNKPVAPTFQAGTPNDGVFDFVYNIASKEAGIKLKPDFAGVDRTSVYKIDVILASSTVKDFAEPDQVLALTYGGAYTIRSLGDSIKLAVRDVAASMDGKVLHTFYIKIAK